MQSNIRKLTFFMDHKFTEQIRQWLETHEDERDYAVGALYLLKLSGNQIMYIEWILEQVGTAEVWQTSFSISEEFLRRLFFITKDKKVSRINLVLDHKATNKTLIIRISFMRRVSAELHSNEPPHQGGQTDARGHGRNGGCRGRRNRCLMCRRDPRPECSTGRKQGGFRKQVWQ